MKKLQVKSVELASVFKLFSGIGFVIGFAAALFGFGLAGESFRQMLQQIPFVGPVMQGFLGAIVFGLVSALCCGLTFALLGVLFNIFSAIMGSLEFDVDEKD